MRINRSWAMPNHRTFQIKPIKKLIEEENPNGITIEPFPYQSKIDCFDYLNSLPDNYADFALIDPPYSKRQISEHYKELGIKVTGWHTSAGWVAKIKDEAARKIKSGGKVITFGWNSNGLGMSRNFIMTRIVRVAHGGNHNDTLCTVETKI